MRTPEINRIKIVEWNVHSVDYSKKDKISKIAENICEQKPDIVVLTEVTFAAIELSKELMEKEQRRQFAVGTCNAGNANNIVIAVARDKIKNVIFEDFYEYVTDRALQEKKDSCEQYKKNHPDSLMVRLELNNGKWINLMGVRMAIGKKTPDEEKKQQILNFMKSIYAMKPDVIIGDYNWNSAFYADKKYLIGEIIASNKPNDSLGKGFSEIEYKIQKLKNKIHRKIEDRPDDHDSYSDEQIFCDVLRSFIGRTTKKDYVMWPTDKKSLALDKWSFRSKRGEGVTSPDRIVYDSNMFNCKADYVPEINENKKFPEDWASDHAMMIATLTFKEKANNE